MSHADHARGRRAAVASTLLLAALSACAADNGAVSKPLVFESSAKRAAAIRGADQASTGASAAATVPPGSAGPARMNGAVMAAAGSPASPAGPASPASPASSAAGVERQPAAAGGSATASSSASASRAAAAGSSAMQAAVAGSGAAGAGAPPGTTAPPSGGATPCTMHVTYNAVGMHGMWYPHNIGALWVEDANGKFIKTLERWAGIRAGYLSNWNMREDQHGTWPSCPFANVCTGPKVPDQMDVMSQATIFEDNAMHTAMWTCKNIDGEVVPDGKYKLFFEEMENIAPTFPGGPLGMVEFEKGPSAMTLMPPDQAPYKNLKIVIEPGAR